MTFMVEVVDREHADYVSSYIDIPRYSIQQEVLYSRTYLKSHAEAFRKCLSIIL